MLERHEFEVDHLDEGPDGPVGEEGVLVAAVELFAHRPTLEYGHAAQEDADESGRKDALVARHACQYGRVGRAQVDVPRQEAEPSCCRGSEDDCFDVD